VLFFLVSLISALGYNLMQIAFKQLGKNQNSWLLPSLLGWSLPLWVVGVILLVGPLQQPLGLTPEYLSLSVLWALLCAATMYVSVFLAQKYPLSELSAYKKVFGLGLAAGVDIIWFGLIPTWLYGLALLAFSGTAFLLYSGRLRKPVGWQADVKLLIIIFGLCAAMAAQLGLYKHTLLMQTYTLSHVFFTEGLASIIYFGVFMVQRGQNVVWKVPEAALPVGLFCVAVIAEAYAFKHLPISSVVAISMVAAALTASYDVASGELHLTRKTYIAFACMALGVLGIALAKAGY
jgi:hypothetical protein